MKNSGGRNGTIEFLRFLCCVIILIRHSEYALPADSFVPFERGALCVEFFFLVSGYLLACSVLKRTQSETRLSAGRETAAFLRRKIAVLMPTLPVAFVFSFFVTQISRFNFSMRGVMDAFTQEIWKPLLLTEAGFGDTNELWYISAMLIAMAVYFPILYRHFDLFIRVIAPLTAAMLLGWLMKSTGSLLNPSKYLGLMDKGLLRAFGEIALGAAVYPAIQALGRLSLKKLAKWLITAFQILSWAFCLYMMYFKTNTGKYDPFILLLITLSVVFSFSHQGALADRMDNRFCLWLGKLSLPIYLSHRWVSPAVGRFYKYFVKMGLYGLGADLQADARKLFWIYLAASLTATALVYGISSFLRRHGKQIGGFFRRLLVA